MVAFDLQRLPTDSRGDGEAVGLGLCGGRGVGVGERVGLTDGRGGGGALLKCASAICSHSKAIVAVFSCRLGSRRIQCDSE